MPREAERPGNAGPPDIADKLAEASEALARTADALADTAEKSARVHDTMAASSPGAQEHAERDRALAEAERQAAAAYRRGEVPADDVREVIRRSRSRPDE